MKALMKLQKGEGHVELREVEEPSPAPDEPLGAERPLRPGSHLCGA